MRAGLSTVKRERRRRGVAQAQRQLDLVAGQRLRLDALQPIGALRAAPLRRRATASGETASCESTHAELRECRHASTGAAIA